MATNVRVVCRFRPQNSIENEHGGAPILSVDETQTTVTIKGSEGNHSFTFDRIFNCAPQKDVYDDAAKPVVEDLFRGYNGTIFVYGQTSSGKTFTMQGPSIDDPQMRGIIPRMNSTIFETVMNADPNIEFLVKASYLEIYMEKIRDLLDSTKSNLKVREEKSKGIWVEGATEVYVSSEQDVLDVIRAGTANRAISATQMNLESSRSHSIFVLTVSQRNLTDGTQKNGKLYLVDLAGSEKVEKTGAQGLTLDEAKMINKSLSSLGNVINALTDGRSSHVPYRDSKLTRVLQESLGGNSRTTLIINCSPSSYNEAETISTLRFGSRAKAIKNKAKVNQERSVTELKNLLAKSEKEISQLQATIAALEDELQVARGTTPLNKSGGQTEQNKMVAALPNVKHLQDQCTELENQLRKLEEEKQALVDLNEELKDKESDIPQLDSLKEELAAVKFNEQTLATENEMLIVKLADITIANEKLQYDTSENQVTIDKLNAENSSLREELSVAKTQITTLLHEKKTQDEWMDREEELKKSDQERSETVEHLASNSDLEHEVEVQKTEIEQLRRDKQLLQSQLESLENLKLAQEKMTTELIMEPTSLDDQGNKDPSQLEKELHFMREQTNQKLAEFDALKAALFKDLENRCQKVIELEMLLDEAREQYQTLLVQVKNSNSKALQQKCMFLQRNLEQLTTVQQQLVNENNKLKLDNQVYVKQLAIRNERIHGLELLLQDAQDKLQRHAINESNGRNQSPNAKKPVPNSLPVGARIAKPIRGGGGGIQPNTMITPSGGKVTITTSGSSVRESDPNRQRSGSIWDIFRGPKPKTVELADSPVNSPTKQPSPATSINNSDQNPKQ